MENETQDRIVRAALDCFSAQGLKKTSMEDVAQAAGVTRVTIYRYFADKRDLAREAFLSIERIFQQADHDFTADPEADVNATLERIGRDLSAFPHGSPIVRLDELRRLYPDVYDEVQAFRLAVMDELFDHLFAASERQGLLRPELNRAFVQAIFWEAIVDIFENPNLDDLGLSNEAMFRQFTDILLHGVLKR